MAIEIFWGSGSPFSWRVLLALEHKQIPYESKLMQFSKGETKTAEYLAMNPRGEVPTLRDGDVVVRESIAILAYLEQRFPQPALFGTSPRAAGAIWQRVMETTLRLDLPGEAFILPIYFGRLEAEAAQVRAAVPSLQAELARIEGDLGSRPWLCGDAISAADLVTYPMVRSVLRAAEKPAAASFQDGLAQLRERHLALGAWMARIEALPFFDRTFPPHWRNG